MTKTDQEEIATLCNKARTAARRLASTSDEVRSGALRLGASRLRAAGDRLAEANRIDLEAGRKAGLTSALIDRLTLTPERVEAMAAGLDTVASLADPLAGVLEEWTVPSGLRIQKVPIPIGVIAVIYESRPNVTADVAALCIKSGNAVILKGGKEAIHTNRAIADVLESAFAEAGIPAGAMQLVRSTDRATTTALLSQDGSIDVIIPRGGPGLVRAIAEHSTVPVIKHYEGVCSVYVDDRADLEMAAAIVMNAKVQRPGVCNAIENLLVHEGVAARFLPDIGARLREAGVELRACPRSLPLLDGAREASEEDWSTEYLDLILAVKVVDSIDEAISFINRYGSGHSDAIVSADEEHQRRFLEQVDSAVVYANASTRFTDGFEFGFGAEVGISTNRIHARGPMGLRELTTYKYVIHGDGTIR
ncbi:MAG: glutamate-5-semialdehyde dehydrogenase [Deltaproteobacteria bacterium]|nr:MAG: glutamate-5-semialdehyde dehydrogenase [Deltaproteobacteria bacterium]